MNRAKQREQERTEAAERAQAQWLMEHGAWNWQWPGSGSLDDPVDLQRNCWFTNNPKPRHTSKAPGTSHYVVGTQTYYGVSEERANKRKARRKSGRLLRAGLKMGGNFEGKGHSYPARTAGS